MANADHKWQPIFITTVKPHLNGNHTIFGKVVKGMDVINKISKFKQGMKNLWSCGKVK
jgi:cyclophilin family peptidyl-prolyl cis-trans isomerase